MKYIKKSKLAEKHGHIIIKKSGKVVGIETRVWCQWEDFCHAVQLDHFLEEQGEQKEKKLTMYGFKFRKSEELEFGSNLKTPIMDKREEERKALAKEWKLKIEAEMIVKKLEYFGDLIKFADDDEVLVDTGGSGITLGYEGIPSILDITGDEIMAVVSNIDWERIERAKKADAKEASLRYPVDIDGDVCKVVSAADVVGRYLASKKEEEC